MREYLQHTPLIGDDRYRENGHAIHNICGVLIKANNKGLKLCFKLKPILKDPHIKFRI